MEVFDLCLLNEDLADLTPELFAQEVRDLYLDKIKVSGVLLPQFQFQQLVHTIEEEALTMFRMKTYGFYDLSAYQKSIFNKVNSNEN